MTEAPCPCARAPVFPILPSGPLCSSLRLTKVEYLDQGNLQTLQPGSLPPAAPSPPQTHQSLPHQTSSPHDPLPPQGGELGLSGQVGREGGPWALQRTGAGMGRRKFLMPHSSGSFCPLPCMDKSPQALSSSACTTSIILFPGTPALPIPLLTASIPLTCTGQVLHEHLEKEGSGGGTIARCVRVRFACMRMARLT